jgi:hypothetical protein
VLADTPDLARRFCPGCEPAADPLCEILAVRWCEVHQPTQRGADDERVTTSGRILSGTGEAEGVDCKLVADLLRHDLRGEC